MRERGKGNVFILQSLIPLSLIPLFFVFANAEVLEKTMATVNGEALYQSDFESNLNNVLNDLQKAGSPELMPIQLREIRSKVLNQMVDDLLLLQEAKQRGIKVYAKDVENGVNEVKSRFKRDEEGRPLPEAEAEKLFQAELRRQRLTASDFEERIRKQLMVIKLVDGNIKAKVEAPQEQDVKNFFEQVKKVVVSSASIAGMKMSDEEKDELLKLAQLFRDRTVERVRGRHILVKLPAKATMMEKSKVLNKMKALRKEIEAGADFAEVAKRESQDMESGRKGGDLGYFIRGWMVPAFEQAAFNLQVGQVSEPVETEFGYHLILIEEKRAATPLRYDEAKEDLTQYLQQRNFQVRLKDFVEGLRAKATIKVLKDPNGLDEGQKKGG
ncbi:MAG: peptidylprolyl isomerase [Elusimicrobia bacterium]|nr:peptidylprolyl isomerase [Elusimicrobiota bacterium]